MSPPDRREAERIRHRAWRAANRGRRAATQQRYYARNAESIRERVRAKDYAAFGATLDDFRLLWEDQGGQCAICREPMVRGVKAGACFDHCHATQTPRGLLCGPCNTGLGGFRDNPENLQAAVRYIEKYTRRQ